MNMWYGGGLSPRFLISPLHTTSGTLTPYPLYCRGKNPQYPSSRRLDRPQCLFGRHREKRNFCPYYKSKPVTKSDMCNTEPRAKIRDCISDEVGVIILNFQTPFVLHTKPRRFSYLSVKNFNCRNVRRHQNIPQVTYMEGPGSKPSYHRFQAKSPGDYHLLL
jgi:hypothetical protein